VTFVERATRRIVSWAVLWERTIAAFEQLVEAAPFARLYYSDAFVTYAALWYPGTYEALPNKSQTFSVEGDNAELRHYLARLARRTRCFSRCIVALTRAVDLLVRTWNERQRFKQAHPKLPAQLIQFLPLPN